MLKSVPDMEWGENRIIGVHYKDILYSGKCFFRKWPFKVFLRENISPQ